VTSGAYLRGLGWTQIFEADDLGDVAAAINMGLRGAVTALASVLVPFQQRSVRSTGKMLLPNFLVAGLADVSLGVLATRGTGQRGGFLRCWSAGVLLRRRGGVQAPR